MQQLLAHRIPRSFVWGPVTSIAMRSAVNRLPQTAEFSTSLGPAGSLRCCSLLVLAPSCQNQSSLLFEDWVIRPLRPPVRYT